MYVSVRVCVLVCVPARLEAVPIRNSACNILWMEVLTGLDLSTAVSLDHNTLGRQLVRDTLIQDALSYDSHTAERQIVITG